MSSDPSVTIGFPAEFAVEEEPETGSPLATAISVGDVLGEGGMAVVHAAVQHSLGRGVAVKSSRRPGADRARLVAEAQITGALEHPHIVPVHDVVVDEDGSRHIVLKRIDGVGWGEVMHDPERARTLGVDQLDEWNLDTLAAVGRALEFAHANGVLHRDLKPDNVMVGAFGQVYVVDWGIAVRTEDLRVAPDRHRRIVGTPRYMPPELAVGDVACMSERTDVYLLGALLYEIATGRPPHRGFAIREILDGISTFDPTVEDPALTEVLRRAMATDPANRYPTAQAFNRAVKTYRAQRVSRELRNQSLRESERLVELMASSRDRTQVYQAFGAARYGMREALRLVPNDRPLADELHALSVAMVKWELDQGNDEAAEAVLASVGGEQPEWRARITAARTAREQRERRLARLERDGDVGFGLQPRAWVLTGLTGLWVCTPMLNRLTGHPAVVSGVVLGLIVVLMVRFRTALAATQRNRTMVALVAGVVVVDVAVTVSPFFGALPAAVVPAVVTAENMGFALVASLLVDRRYALVFVALGLTFLFTHPIGIDRMWLAIFNSLVSSVVTLWVFDVRPSHLWSRDGS